MSLGNFVILIFLIYKNTIANGVTQINHKITFDQIAKNSNGLDGYNNP